MSPRERRRHILERLKVEGKVEIIQLAEELQVTPMTIRRDFDALEKQKNLIRTHGGAVLPQALIGERTFESKAVMAVVEKKAIAREAIEFIQAGMTILLDSGTTTLEIAKQLKFREDVTVVTNDIKIAAELMDSKLEVIVLGGRLQNDVGALFGSVAEEMLRSIHVDLFFLGAHAVHPSFGITSPTFEKSSLKQRMNEAAEQIILVTDSSKFDRKSFAKVCDLDQITAMITDDKLSELQIEAYEAQVDIIRARQVEQ
ncbi:DeoR/GlpR family DNA-binding transcription regulator [Sporosarcina sp. HYO08]|uniref:DeoR/GlpR family DNA-binding transcription regulator n=1 Tax=Sporosarcina sp. HYO08 TaxID=1759557 RepID=UPI000799834D|nr:DeoR/GlpR family DNA-binding transcription regulator [Sporosarcina sp. HYO08]KXH80891.1 transcriptional regulator [Sporosarcina sp. HYO08]